jgi:arylsulfatase A
VSIVRGDTFPASLRALLCLGAAAAFPYWAAMGAETAADRKPNIILVLLDDVSAKEFTCYGGQGISTPTLDRMAREGVMFRTAWSTPLCGPSRALLHTGRYGGRTQYLDNDIMPGKPFWTQHQVLGKVLQSAGYATTMIGKSHFSNHPHADLGFDEYCIARYWPGYDGPPQAAAAQATASMYAVQWYWHPGLVVDGKGYPTKADDFAPDIEVDRIKNFIGRHKSQPFFVYYPMNMPHMMVNSTNTPTSPGARWNYTDVPARDAHGHKTGKRIKGSLKTDLEYIDYLIGQIWAQVVADGLEQRTVLLVTGDNGTAGYGKGKLNSEVALRVPFIVYGPGQVKRAGPSDALVDFADILPTLADLGGARLPEGYTLDGMSFAPLLQGKPLPDRGWIHSYLGTARWLRDQRWLLDGNGKFYDCGTNRDETAGYRDVTASTEPEVLAAKSRFEAILKIIPAPDRNDPVIGPALNRFDKAKGAGKAAAPSPNGEKRKTESKAGALLATAHPRR